MKTIKENIEINWINMTDATPEFFELLEEDGTFLERRSDCKIIVCYMAYSDIFRQEYFAHDDIKYFLKGKELTKEEADIFLDQRQFVAYTRHIYEEFGDYNGCDICFSTEAVLVARIPVNPILNAIANQCD